VASEDLIRAVDEALEKDRVARLKRSETISIGKRFATLTPRERQVLEHVVNGNLKKQTAAALGTAEKTFTVPG
jgi:FixJ family two-component response regulator